MPCGAHPNMPVEQSNGPPFLAPDRHLGDYTASSHARGLRAGWSQFARRLPQQRTAEDRQPGTQTADRFRLRLTTLGQSALGRSGAASWGACNAPTGTRTHKATQGVCGSPVALPQCRPLYARLCGLIPLVPARGVPGRAGRKTYEAGGREDRRSDRPIRRGHRGADGGLPCRSVQARLSDRFCNSLINRRSSAGRVPT